MAVYSYAFSNSAVIVSASPIWGFADLPDAVSLEETDKDCGILTLRLLESSKGNAVLSAFALVGRVTPTFLPAVIIPGGMNSFIWASNAVFASGRGVARRGTGGTIAWWQGNTGMMPTTYTLGNEVGVVEWKITLVGLEKQFFGG